MMRRVNLLWALLLMLWLLSACGPLPVHRPATDGAPAASVDFSRIPDAVPRWEPYGKSGNPPSYEVYGKRYNVMASGEGYLERGQASWYGTKFHGRATSSGEPYDLYAMTAAHKTLPLPTYAEVTNLENGRRIVVRINDRGPFNDERLLDLSYAAAGKLGILGKGVGRVEVRSITTNPAVLARAVSPPPPAGVVVAPLSGIYLQVASFGDRENLQRGLTRLLDAKIDQVLVQQDSSKTGTILYRLRIGPLPDRGQAEQLVTRLNALGFEQTYIVD